MKILITGVSGMLGFNLQKVLSEDHCVFSTGNSNFPEEPENYMVFDLKSNSFLVNKFISRLIKLFLPT